MDGDAAAARTKAAAWAWYQRGSGQIGVGGGRSEAFAAAPDRRPRRTPSRFKLEATLLLASVIDQKIGVGGASVEAESFHLPANLNDYPTEITSSTSAGQRTSVSSPPEDAGVSSSSTADLVLALSCARQISVAAWDCGSSLFDSFELVAMSKKLECAHQLNAFFIDKVRPPAPDITCAAVDEQEEEEVVDAADLIEVRSVVNEPVVFLPTTWISIEAQVGITPHDQIISESDPASHPDQSKNSKQAVYDMFCRYDSSGSMNCGCEDVVLCNHGSAVKKPKPSRSRKAQHRMPRLHSFSKVFHHIAHLTYPEHSFSQKAQRLQSHHHQVSSPKTQQLLPRLGVAGITGNPKSASLFRDRAPADGTWNGNNKHSDHVHHHHYHHHHYHYLFHHHQDEEFRALQPTLAGADKSLMVAAAGLRTPKRSALQGYLPFNGNIPKTDHGTVQDYMRKWKGTRRS